MTTGRRRRLRLWPRLRRLVKVPLAALGLVLGLLAAWAVYAGARLAWTETEDRRNAAPAGGRWLRAHDVDIHVQEWGAADAPVLLLVHGAGAWGGAWASNIEAMQAAGFRVVALDLPPFGFSERPASRDYSRMAQARRILAVAQQLGPQELTLLGHSLGGGPAAEAVMLEPARFAHLVLVDAAMGLQEQAAPCEPPGAVAKALAWPGLRALLVGAVGTEPAFSEFWLERFVSRKEAVTTARTAIYQRPFVTRQFSRGLGDWAYQFATACDAPASTRPAALRQLQVPVSLVWGRLDTVTPLAQGEHLRALLPRAKLTVLEGVGHIPQIEDIAGFNFALAKVLAARP